MWSRRQVGQVHELTWFGLGLGSDLAVFGLVRRRGGSAVEEGGG